MLYLDLLRLQAAVFQNENIIVRISADIFHILVLELWINMAVFDVWLTELVWNK